MDYQYIYDRLTHPGPRVIVEYTEKHHILPRCMGGDDTAENVIRLTAREHYIAHLLLWKIHKSPSTAYAVWMMQCFSAKQKRFEIRNSRQYQKIREHVISILKETPKSESHRRNLSLSLTGKKRKPHTEETKLKIRNAKLGRKNSPEHCRNAGLAHRGKHNAPLSAEHKAKIGAANKGKVKTAEHREKLSKAHRGVPGPKHSEATLQKMRKPKSDEWKAKARLTQTARRLREMNK
jgi:hypothetical protein